MIRWKNLLSDALNAVEVVTFDYPYISARKPPPKAEKLVEFHAGIVKEIANKYPQHPLILVGKSMGSRVSCMVAAEEGIEASAVVCLGYPLKGTKGAIRDAPLLQLEVPTMFVQGTKDGLCPLASLEMVMKKMKAKNSLHIVENGDHSFKIAKKNLELAGITHEEAEQSAVQAIAMFVSQINGTK
ncbi:alpha/beta-Hydrolases superfamily protein [Artemisia annua]|uniref:Alpha/beta-Hydrolases superfamily protein n=1 Tax=Artemisia annua TaxID=35608 RepID=A0A2U1PQN4_ARTAN|nr:alpha/beta-Hydrolases superfamily protein [Artemisia annua]